MKTKDCMTSIIMFHFACRW